MLPRYIIWSLKIVKTGFCMCFIIVENLLDNMHSLFMTVSPLIQLKKIELKKKDSEFFGAARIIK